MDLKFIRNLVRLMERGELSELEIDDERAGLRLHLKRGSEPAGGQGPVMMMPGTAAAPASAPSSGDAGDRSSRGTEAAASRPAGTSEIVSPMVGTYYRAPSPDSDPFVQVGTQFDEDSVICIIEAMKVMNEIKAETRGEIVELLVENGEPVEFGQPLFLVKPI